MSDLSIRQLSFVPQGESQKRIIRFLDGQLRHGAGFSVHEEYPSLFGEFPGGESYFIEADNAVVAHAASIVREFRLQAAGEFRLKLGLIGSVATAVEQRGRGLASQLVLEALQSLKRRGCALAVLWSSTPEFYLPFGFHRAGREIDYRFSAETVAVGDSESVPFELSRHAQSVWQLYQKQDVRIDRSLEEQKRLCRIPCCRIFITEKDGQATSYLAIQKGADFENFIHEWAGDLGELARNIAGVQRNIYREQPLTLIAPAHLDLGPIRAMASDVWPGVVGLFKVLDRVALLDIYCRYLKAQGIEFSHDSVLEEFHLGGRTLPLSTDKEYLSLIFGGDASEFSEKPSPLPNHPWLPFFLWGFDSI